MIGMGKAIYGALFGLGGVLIPLGFEVSGIEDIGLAIVFWGVGLVCIVVAIVIWVSYAKDMRHSRRPIKLDENRIGLYTKEYVRKQRALGRIDVLEARRQAVEYWKKEVGYPLEDTDDGECRGSTEDNRSEPAER